MSEVRILQSLGALHPTTVDYDPEAIRNAIVTWLTISVWPRYDSLRSWHMLPV